MTFLNALLGFAVLTGPLWLILILLFIAIWIAAKAVKRFEHRGTKIVVGLLVFFFVFLVPFGDEIAGRIYLNHLCATEAGVKVYKTVELPAEYWDKQGKPMFTVYGGADNRQTMFMMGTSRWEDVRFEYSMFVEPLSSFFYIERTGFRLRERESGEILGEVLYFRYWHGWLARNLSPDRSATSCEMKNLDEWKFNVFKPSAAK